MGRAGGGGSRSSGGGPERSSGGRSNSFGGRSNSFGGDTGRSQSYEHHGNHAPNFMGRRRYSNYGGGGGSNSSLASVIAMIVMLIIVLYVVSSKYSFGGVTSSTVEREPLAKGSVVETAYYTDKLDWVNNETKLTAGMQNFYKATGVQPYLYITDNINGKNNPTDKEIDVFTNSLYDTLFEDEAHVLLVFFEYDSKYTSWYVCGKQAKTVIDSEAADILLDYVDKYYSSSMSEEEMFSTAFNSAGERIMEKTVLFSRYVVAGVIVIVALLIMFAWWVRAKKQKNLEAVQDQAILNTPLEEFGDKSLEDLANKYQGK